MNRDLKKLAKPLYVPEGNNSWKHIQQVYDNASNIVNGLEHRKLTPEEEAAVLFHDSSVLQRGMSKEDHGIYGAQIAKEKLKQLGWRPKVIKKVMRAIEQHDSGKDTYGKWDSPLGELLAAADANPPDPEWILNKSYVWGIRKRLEHKARLQNTITSIPDKYGINGDFYKVAPKPYMDFYGAKIDKQKEVLEGIRNNPKLLWKIVKAYRKKHGLGPDDIRLPDPEY